MIINNYIQSVAGVYSANQPTAARRTEAAQETLRRDEFVPSKEGQSFRAMLEKLKNMDEVREDKVADLKAAVQNGAYGVSSEDIAAKMLATRF